MCNYVFFRNNGMVLLNVDVKYYHKQFKLYLCAIFLADDHYFYGKGDFGVGSNNWAELQALFHLLQKTFQRSKIVKQD